MLVLNLSKSKINFENLNKEDLVDLERIYKNFKKQSPATIQYKLNKGKEVGNFNSSKLWHITDESDNIFLKCIGISPNEVFNSIQKHIKSTVISIPTEEEEE